MLNKCDDIASSATSATIENLLVDSDGEAVVAAAHGAWSNQLAALPLQIADAAPIDFIFDPYGACTLDDVI